ncbi:cold-shock protein [Oceanospirillum sediminis]|uniref:Cold shock domain-containing protein n=1 Tax=Oceanospirillum sediminis TaxID=2760088 RepID=A0A839IK62_9GAMM|nr:cold shock domain-containing protein [Oceanospirillum sediminis]MBB1485110.1 cold shock domain-containing protein [Oceanospirillum sediminis]
MSKNSFVRCVLISLVMAVIGPFAIDAVTQADITQENFVQAAVVFFLTTFIGTAALNYMTPQLANITNDENDDREMGTVKWFNVSKGFGFITRDSGGDVFVHFRSIRGTGHRSLAEGQRVRFAIIQSDKGLQAEDVTVIS